MTLRHVQSHIDVIFNSSIWNLHHNPPHPPFKRLWQIFCCKPSIRSLSNDEIWIIFAVFMQTYVEM